MKPIVLAMIICDHYYRDAHTGKSILSGTFSSINASSFPSKHGNCAVYLALTDLAGPGTLQLVFSQEGGPFSMKLPPWNVQAPENRRAVIEIGGNINGLPLPAAGNFEFSVRWNDAEIFSRRLTITQVSPPDQKQQGPGDNPDPTAPPLI